MAVLNLYPSHEIEKRMGILFYCTKTEGILGQLRTNPKDFIVEEILPDGRILKLNDENFSFGENEPGLFTEFILIKKNIESHRAQLRIASALGIPNNDIKVAGTKDKMAITSQRATIWRIPPEKLLSLELKGIKIHSPRTTIYQTYLGDLLGNHFTIVIRKSPFEEETISQRVNTIKEELVLFGGVGNFFGHQRFGTRRPISHEVGKEILLGNIKQAVISYIAEVSEFEHELTTNARKGFLETNDPKYAYELFSSDMIFERMILHHLIKYPNDYLGAFQLLPKNLQRLFIHAYQSYIWNLVLSERIRYYGHLRPHPSDMIENGKVVFPIIGLYTKKQDDHLFNYTFELLEKDGIMQKHFRLPHMKGMNFPGSNRKMIINPENFNVTVEDKDKESKTRLQFSLGSGSYATVILREFMKASPLFY